MKSCYIELYIYAGIPFFFNIFLMFSIKKINTGNFKKKYPFRRAHIFPFLLWKKTKNPLFFSIKRLGKYSSRRTRDFFFVFVLFFYESREKRSGLNMETKTTIRPDPPRPRVSRCVVFITWQTWQYHSLLPKEFKIWQVDVMSQLKKNTDIYV